MQNRIIGVIAPKGSGKTYTVSQALMNMEKVAVFDMVREEAYLCCEPIVGRPKFFAEQLRQEQFKLAYRPTIFSMKDAEEYCPEFEPFVKCCYLRGNMWMVIDEAHLLCTSRMCPDALVTAATIGRHRELNIVYVTQSFSAIAMPLRQNTDEFLFWKIIEPTSLDAIRQRCGTEMRDKVVNLRATEHKPDSSVIPGQMIRWNTTHGIVEETP